MVKKEKKSDIFFSKNVTCKPKVILVSESKIDFCQHISINKDSSHQLSWCNG